MQGKRMAAIALTAGHESQGTDLRIGRRDLLVLSAAAVAALWLETATPDPASISLPPGSVGGPRWGWQVELAVLARLDGDRSGALDLLRSALDRDLDAGARGGRKPALRLYDLYAAIAGAPARIALAERVEARSANPQLLARAARWADPAYRRRSPLWRTVGPDRRPLGIMLDAA
jgi:hypothetical protein